MKSIWFIGLIVVVFLAVIAAVVSKKSVRTELFIPAPAGDIWRVLMDEAGYQHWNPVLVPLSGSLEQGETMRYRWKQPAGQSIEVDSKVIQLLENELLHQRGGTTGILTFDHRYQLTPEADGTRVVQSEVYRGIGVWFWDASQMQLEYQRVNEALLARVLAEQ